MSAVSQLTYFDCRFMRDCLTCLLVMFGSSSFDLHLEGLCRSFGVCFLDKIALYFPEPVMILVMSEFIVL